MSYSLEKVLIQFNKQHEWYLRNAVEGVQIFGGIGSGKTSGSGRTLALKYLKEGFGGLVLSVKADERELWEGYCKEAGRSIDLIIIKPECPHRFNFIDYEMNREGEGKGLTANLVTVLKTVIRAGQTEHRAAGINGDAFWEDALDMLMFSVIDLCYMAYRNVTLEMLLNIAQSIPDNLEKLKEPAFYEENAFGIAMDEIRNMRINKSITDKQFRLYKSIENYFLSNYIPLNHRTRAIIEHSFLGLLFQLNRDPVYSLFCSSEKNNIIPDNSIDGKIIFIDLPVKQFDNVGKSVQILFKYIWQRAMERRDISKNDRPVFLWADEAQNFIHEHDMDYQATARSSRVCTVYLTQNLPNYMACMGGNKDNHRVYSFLGNMSTKIFHANTDKETNDYASNLIGHDVMFKRSDSLTFDGKETGNSTTLVQERLPVFLPKSFSD